MLTYSIAIRTLGTGGENFRRELESIARQTVQPQKTLIYIAEGFPRPDFQIGDEEYVWVKKGMMSQRALPYNEITSDCILTLDDDVELSPMFAETMLNEMESNRMDVLGADVFKVHRMSLKSKIFAGLTNLVFPSYSSKYAFRIKANGSFNYLNHPEPTTYLSQSCAGPAILWKKHIFAKLKLSDETWLDSFGFPFGEDALTTYKIFSNNYRLGVSYTAELFDLNSQTSSRSYRNRPDRFYIRSKAMFATWWRMLFKPYGNQRKGNHKALIFGSLKFLWLTFIMAATSIYLLNPSAFTSHIKGLRDGFRFVKSDGYQQLSPYIL